MPGVRMGRPRGRGPLSPPLLSPWSGEESSWPTGVASWTRDFPPLPLLLCSWEFHPPEPRPEWPEPEEREPPDEDELEPEEREPPDEDELEDEPPDLPKRASATVVVKKHPAASAAHSVCLGDGRGCLLGMRFLAAPFKHFSHPSGRHSPAGDACPTG
jgi:hypothetical protein